MSADLPLYARLHVDQLRLWERLHPRRADMVRAIEERVHPGYRFPWRVAEAPSVAPRELFERDADAMRRLLRPYFTAAFRERFRDLCPARWRRPDGGGWFPRFIATDFQRVFVPERGFEWYVPEIQSFPGNLLLKPVMVQGAAAVLGETAPAGLDPRYADFEAYVGFLRRLILGSFRPEETIILEIRPREQKTVVDMLLAVKHLGVRLVDLRDLAVDPATREAVYRRATVFRDGAPVLADFDRPQVARNILSRCLPEEVEEALAAPDGGLDPAAVEGVFQGTVDRGTAAWVVHPQDFFVLSKAALAGNPEHRPPIRPVTRALLDELEAAGTPLKRGVIKAASSAGGKGLRGWSGGLVRKDIEALLDDIDRRNQSDPDNAPSRQLLWQERYGADAHLRTAIPGFVPGGDDERDPIYCEVRLMWAAEPRTGGAPEDIDLTLLTAMTRWSRVGQPANAGFQKTPFTGTHGYLVT